MAVTSLINTKTSKAEIWIQTGPYNEVIFDSFPITLVDGKISKEDDQKIIETMGRAMALMEKE
jgi:hypothetical protein